MDRKRSEKFYMDTVIFQVEDTLFKVSTAYFVKNSAVFRDMFSLPLSSADNNRREGTSDDNPVVLEDVKADDFERMLEYMYAEYGNKHEISLKADNSADTAGEHGETIDVRKSQAKGILAVMKLARRWMFQGLYAHLIRELKDEWKTNPVEQILAGREHGIPHWLRSGYRDLLNRRDPLSIQESRDLGYEDAIRLCQLREARWRKLGDPTELLTVVQGRNAIAGRKPHFDQEELDVLIERLIESGFGEDLRAMQQEYADFFEIGDK